MRTMRAGVLTMIGVLLICRAAGATGLLMPEDKQIPPLAVKSHRVSVQIKDGVATTSLTEVFQNSTDRRLEATYVFPIPAEAALTDFAMYINGKRESGEVVEADTARQIYEDIVRRMRDPGLLEYMGSRLLKMRVFPIEPQSTQKIEVSYVYALPFDNGVYRYTFPLRTGEKASSVLEDSTFSVEITSTQPIVNIYSPTHEVGISSKGERSAVVGFEEEGAMLDKDFVLYYGLGDKDFGLNLLTYRPKGQDGYFALMLAPRVELGEEKVMPKDVCFLVDVSGSMAEQNRIASAKEALKFCLNSLNAKDRFALLTFSTSVDVFGEGLTEATKENVEKAVAYVDKLEAEGGTAFCDAVVKGLQTAPPEGDRPYIVVLITDGKPTVGKYTEPDDIIAQVKAVNKTNVRVFTFGIADTLDVPLLDRIAEITKGYSEYVEPGRQIETEISSFFRKVSYPVLANLKLDFGKVKVLDMYPQELPDLFRGSRVLAFGRYSDGGHVAVKLTGSVGGKTREFVYDADFPEVAGDNEFIPHLWAQRKIAYLLDEIRLHGENEELKGEVIRLSKEYGIATPYTSYLVLENEEAYRQHGIGRSNLLGAARKAAPSSTGTPEAAREEDLKLRSEAAERWEITGERLKAGAGYSGYGGGKADVELSRAMQEWKDSRTSGEAGLSRVEATLKNVAGKTFVRIRGVFIDTEFEEGMKTLKLKWGSDAYFAALRAMPELKKYLALGENVIVVVKGKALIVGEEGEEALSEQEIAKFFE